MPLQCSFYSIQSKYFLYILASYVKVKFRKNKLFFKTKNWNKKLYLSNVKGPMISPKNNKHHPLQNLLRAIKKSILCRDFFLLLRNTTIITKPRAKRVVLGISSIKFFSLFHLFSCFWFFNAILTTPARTKIKIF